MNDIPAQIKRNEELIAPCGLNCGVCKSYLAKERGLYKSKSSGCMGCIPGKRECRFIKDGCEKYRKNDIRFCFECGDFPCERIEKFEKRYTAKYHTSLIGNLLGIQNKGMSKWLAEEEKKWKCPQCGGTVSMHDGKCYDCGYKSKGKEVR
ncbi:DUF3795 domain-containing protein [Chloroflexota bacterium]